ncbi:MAG: response regulator transcription factor, partial [Chloroflexi bacterium]|nr:response regulator transcription factor [Chloroflexota bacterium]
LFDLLEGVRRGEAALSGTLAAKILQEFRQPDKSLARQLEVRDELTPREIEVLKLVVEGDSNKEIAAKLGIQENTVKIHLRNILEKLHLQNRLQAAVYAVRQKLVEDVLQGE